MPLPIDPFTQCLTRQWEILEAFTDWSTLVKPGNRLKEIDKTAAQDADMPEYRIVPAPGGELLLFNTSDSSRFTQVFSHEITTYNLTPAKVFAVKWQAVRAFVKAIKEQGDKLGLPFVEKVRFIAAVETPDGFNQRGTRGWSAVLGIAFQFRFPNTEIISGAV